MKSKTKLQLCVDLNDTTCKSRLIIRTVKVKHTQIRNTKKDENLHKKKVKHMYLLLALFSDQTIQLLTGNKSMHKSTFECCNI